MSEQFQSVGARAKYIYALEDSWGAVAAAPNWRHLRLVPNETMDQNLQIYRSQEIRDDRMRNATVRGSQRPGGTLPFELSPEGWNPMWWHLLGGSVTTTGPVDALATPGAPTATPSGTGGTLAAGTTYQYKITAINAVGETVPGAANSAATTTGSTSKIVLTWSAVTGATGYKIYGRVTGSFQFMASVGAVTTWTDYGNITPAGAVPASDTAGAVYTHVITGSPTLPVGFTMQKGFLDQGMYIPFYGCRVSKMMLNFNIDQIAAGTFDILARQCGDPSQASLNIGADPTRPVSKPFTSAQVSIYSGPSLVLLGTGRSMQTSIDNNFFGDRGFVLGSQYRTNLKPGERVTEAGGTFQFKDMELYQAATRGESIALRIAASNGPYGVQIDYTNFQWLPNNTTPKATDNGPIEITANGEALPDEALGTDVTVTITSPEASIVI